MYPLEYKYQNYTFHLNRQFHLWLQKCSASLKWRYCIFLPNIFIQIPNTWKNSFWDFFFQKEIIFLDLAIPLRYPHLQGSYAFSWLLYPVPLCSARCLVAKFHSAWALFYIFTIFTYSLCAGSLLVIPGGVGQLLGLDPRAGGCDRDKQTCKHIGRDPKWSIGLELS